jgi:poly(3-hydroxybutyrate) depolymerase
VPTRRAVLAGGAGLVLAGLLAGCEASGGPGPGTPAGPAVLSARPAAPVAGAPAPTPGTRTLDSGSLRDPLLHVPPGLPAGEPLPLVVILHGAGGDPGQGLDLLRPLADEFGLVLLAPASVAPTWDAVGGTYGPDVQGIDTALGLVFAELPVDGDRVAIGGFSDGGSYALGLGLANGPLFSRVIAFSPGFVPAGPRTGRPAVFVSHGEADAVLPIDRTSRRIVPSLREDGYDVDYREFPGPHTVPQDQARAAVEWLGWA